MEITKPIKNFFKLFTFKIGGKNKSSAKKIIPTKANSLETQEFPSYVNNLFNLWKQNSQKQYDFHDRRAMYLEMDSMFESNALMSRALELRTHEIVQADVNNQIIQVECDDLKLQKEIEKTLIKLDIDAHLFSTSEALIKYGDAGWILTYGKNGVEEILNANPYDIDDRVEFTPQQIEKEVLGVSFNTLFKSMSNDQKLNLLATMIDKDANEDEYASFFRSYLFGFQIGSFVIPPWRFLHFRNFQLNSMFQPFGTPAFIHSLAPVKLYDMALGLQILARQVRMPVDVYKLVFPSGGMPTDKLEMANQFVRQWQNSGLKSTRKEITGIGEAQVTIRDLFEYEQITPNIDLGKIDDIEMLRDDVIISTGLPRNFLDPNNGSFGNSGVSLMQQFKPFARRVYKDQSILLGEISQLIKIDLILKGYDLKNIKFKLSMPYPESQVNSELISSQRDLLDLSNNILDAIKDRVGGGEEVQLPVSLVRDVYKKVTSFDPQTIDKWVDEFVSASEEAKKQKAKEEPEEGEDEKGKDFTFESLKRVVGTSKMNEIIREEIEKGKIEYATEHTSSGKHFYSSEKVNFNFKLNYFERIEKNNLKKLNESLKINEDEFNKYKENKTKRKKRSDYAKFSE